MAPQFAPRLPPVSSPPPPESPYFARDPPSDLHSYQRSLYRYTLKQAEASSALPTQAVHHEPAHKSQDAQTGDHDDEKHTEHIEHAG
jgi:hypothetical protein